MNNLAEATLIIAPGGSLLFLLIFASGFFSGSETAFFSLTRDDLRRFQLGSKSQRLVSRLMQDPDQLLTVILLWNLVINLSYFAVSLVTAGQLVAREMPGYAAGISVLSLVGIILLGEVAPKSIAVIYPRFVAPLVGWPMSVAIRVVKPMIPFLIRTARVLKRTIWPHIEREKILDADDLERVVDLSSQSRELVKLERQVLHNILDLSEITAEEVMRPRGTYPVMSEPLAIDRLPKYYPFQGYVGILEPKSEEVAGVISFATLALNPKRKLSELVEKVVYAPWCALLSDILSEMRLKLCNATVVVNEYGETIGLVTYEDIVATIIDAQPSRTKRVLRREPVLKIAPGRFHVEGITTLRYLAQRIGTEEADEDERYITVAGILHDQLERIPQPGDQCEWRGYRLQVIEAGARGRMRVDVADLSIASNSGLQPMPEEFKNGAAESEGRFS